MDFCRSGSTKVVQPAQRFGGSSPFPVCGICLSEAAMHATIAKKIRINEGMVLLRNTTIIVTIMQIRYSDLCKTGIKAVTIRYCKVMGGTLPASHGLFFVFTKNSDRLNKIVRNENWVMIR
jgi:hypothetical protein